MTGRSGFGGGTTRGRPAGTPGRRVRFAMVSRSGGDRSSPASVAGRCRSPRSPILSARPGVGRGRRTCGGHRMTRPRPLVPRTDRRPTRATVHVGVGQEWGGVLHGFQAAPEAGVGRGTARSAHPAPTWPHPPAASRGRTRAAQAAGATVPCRATPFSAPFRPGRVNPAMCGTGVWVASGAGRLSRRRRRARPGTGRSPGRRDCLAGTTAPRPRASTRSALRAC